MGPVYNSTSEVRNATCVCDSCASTDANGLWTSGSCNNGTASHADYCENGTAEMASLCTPYNIAYYQANETYQTLYADYGVDEAIAHGAIVMGYESIRPLPAPIGSCYSQEVNCFEPHGSTCSNNVCSPLQTCDDTRVSCANISDCCPGNYCHYDNTCHPYSCNSLGESCEANSECCSPYACVNGYCSRPPSCQTSGMCNTDTDCCQYAYCNSNYYCTACMSAGNCNKNSACCSGYCNNSGMCVSTPCKKTSGTCTTNSDCCYGLSCSNGLCMPS